MLRPLKLLVHGESGAGKTWLGDTAPYPRLTLDAEGGSDWTFSTKRLWDPVREQPPAADGTWETCIVRVRDFNDVNRTYQWLNSGQHQFASVVIDSTTEVQKRCLDAIAGTSAPSQQAYGQLLRDMETTVRQFRDLTFHPVNPLQALVLITTTRADQQGVYRPHVIGQLALSMPYLVDVVGFQYATVGSAGEPTFSLLIRPTANILAKDRTHRLSQRWGGIVESPNVKEMMEVLNG